MQSRLTQEWTASALNRPRRQGGCNVALWKAVFRNNQLVKGSSAPIPLKSHAMEAVNKPDLEKVGDDCARHE